MTKKSPALQAMPPKPKPRYGWIRRIIYWVLGTLIACLLFFTALVFYIGTESGLKNLPVLLDRVTGGAVHIAGVEGRLWHDVTMQGLRIETSEMKIAIDSLQLRWQASRLFSGELVVSQLAIGPTRMDTKPTVPKPVTVTEAPSSLTLPLRIKMADVTLARFALNSDQAVVSDMALTLKSDGVQHQLSVRRLATPVGKLRAQATLSGIAPFATQAQIDLVGTIAEKPMAVALQVKGSLRQLYILGGAESPLFNADVDVLLDVFSPYKYNMLRNGKVEVSDFDPHVLNPTAPKAQIFLKADIRPVGSNHASGRMYLENRQASAIDLQGLPLKSLEMHWQVFKHRLQIDTLNMYLGKGGQVSGQGVLQPTTFSLDLAVQAMNLQDIMSKQMRSSAVKGTIKLQGVYHAPSMQVKLQDTAHQIGLLLNTGWRTSAQEQTLLIQQLLLTQQQGKLSATGELGLAGKRPFKLNAKIDAFDPAQLGHYPSGNLHATVNAEGFLPPQLQAKIAYCVQPSHFNGAPLSGKGNIIWHDHRLEQVDMDLRLGSNYAAMKGQYGAPKDQLMVQLDFANLGQLGAGFAGSLRSEANISGHQEDIVIQTRIQAAGLTLPGGIAIRTLNLDGHVEPNLQRPFHLTVEGESIQVSQLNLARIHTHIAGTRAHHSIHIDGQGKWGEQPLFAHTRLIGSLPKITSWQGNIQALKMGFASGTLALHSPAKLQLSPENIQLEQAALASAHSQVIIQKLAMGSGKIDTQGQLVRLDIADMLAWMPKEATKSDLVLNGHWHVKADETINGSIELKRQQGNIIWHSPTPGAKPIALKLSDVNLHATVNNARANIEANVIAQEGMVKASAVTALSRQEGKWGVYTTSPLTLRVAGNIPNLEAMGAFISPTLKLGGRLNMDVTHTGTVGRATLAGTVRGNALTIQDTERGINLTDGIVNARLTPDTFLLERLAFKGGGGALNAEGTMGLNKRNGSIKIRAERLTALSRPDRLIILSGQSSMFLHDGELTIAGQVHVDEAKIRLARGDAPTLSEDVVVVGRIKPQQVKTENFTLAALQLDLDLGEKTTFRGKGLEAVLGGKLHVTAQAKQPIYATGVIRVDQGSYRAYGQNLTVKRGFISFQGPLDNPGLDIVAVRQGPAVEAGVNVSGTAIRPRVTLISEPNVPDNEKISWMMFGKSVDTLNPQDGASVLAAASSLWLTGDGPSLQERIADTVGLDEVLISSGTTVGTAATTYLTLGKQLADNIYLSYEQSLGEVDSALKLQYIFSRHWQAVARAGTKETTFDIFYTLSFD